MAFCAYAFDECEAMERQALATGKYPPWYKNRAKPFPKFQYVPPAGADYATVMAADGGILAGMMVVFFMLSYLKFLRYDVR